MYEIKESNIVFGDYLSMKDILMLLYKDTFDWWSKVDISSEDVFIEI